MLVAKTPPALRYRQPGRKQHAQARNLKFLLVRRLPSQVAYLMSDLLAMRMEMVIDFYEHGSQLSGQNVHWQGMNGTFVL